MIPIQLGLTDTRSWIRRFGRVPAGPSVALALVFLAWARFAAASEPEIIRVQVPATQTSRWFPARTELRVMPAEQFESLARRATEGLLRQRGAQPPRLIRARHHAKWGSGVLTGRTELLIAAASNVPADYVLDPWSPAIVSAASRPVAGFPDGELPCNPFAVPALESTHPRGSEADPLAAHILGARDSGKSSLWIDRPSRQAVDLDWELQGQKRARGRSFNLALPGDETTILELDLPRDWIPFSRVGRRHGPLEAHRPDRSLWEVEAESGRIELELYDPDEGVRPLGSNLWVSGATQIDLRATTDRSGGLVNWSTDWLVELDPRNPKPLEVELDPGLELINVEGPAVRGYHIEPRAGAPRVVVTLEGALESATEVRFLAHARIPTDAPWSIPAIRPSSATWTGGTTTVILDAFHVVAECNEKSGRRLFGPEGESGPINRLVFQAESPQSVAELIFRKPRALSSCFIRGHLFVSGWPCRLECQLDWTTEQRLTPELEIELSPEWIPDRVLIRGSNDPLAWHPSLLPSGSTILHVAVPALALSQKEISLIVSAASTKAAARGPLELPRVRPRGPRIVDEAWLAWADQATMIQPQQARGLAWIDPGQVPGLLTARGPLSNLREALAWRWIAEDAAARVDRQPIDQEPSARVHIDATVDPAKERVTLDGRLSVTAAAAALEAVPVWIETSASSSGSLIFDDPAGGPLPSPRPIDGPARARLGLPEAGLAVDLAVKIASGTEKTIHFHAQYPWTSGSPVPLVAVSRKYLQRGLIVVKTEGAVRSRFKAAGLRLLEKSAGSSSQLDPDREAEEGSREDHSVPAHGNVHSFAYSEPGGRLELLTEPLVPLHSPGVIREAMLATSVGPGGSALYRLRLLVHCGLARSLDLVLPREISLARVRRDGTDVAPMRSGRGLSIPLPGASQGSRLSNIVVDYVVGRESSSGGGLMRPVLPAVSFPCLSFTWEVIAPLGWQAVDCGPGLVAVDRDSRTSWPDAGLNFWNRAWNFWERRGRNSDAEILSSLDDRLVDSTGEELTFAEWFTRWDSGPRPLIVDRVSLNRAGFGPKSICIPIRVKSDRRHISLATLEQHGLGLALFPNALVVTTAADLSRLEQRERWSGAIAEALLWGSDRTDRLETLPHWRGESSPRIAALGGDETAERIKVLEGWSTWKFTAPGWPGDNAFLYVIDGRARLVTGWLIAAALLVAWAAWRRRIAHMPRRFLALGLLTMAAVLFDWLLPSRYASYVAGLFAGGLLILIVELSRGTRRLPAAERGRTESSLLRRLSGPAVTMALLGLLLAQAARGQPAIPPAPGSAILALFPYEGKFDPTRPAKDVILRLADFRRLTEMAEADLAAPPASVRAVSVVHHVRPKAGRDVVVETELKLVASGHAPFTWRVPVTLARDIETKLDGARVPLSIEPGGSQGTVAIPRAGIHVLSIRRSCATRNEGGFETLNLPVNAMPSARVVVDPSEGGKHTALLTSSGPALFQANGSYSGRLGPADRLEVRWAETDAVAARQLMGTVEGLVLWDITRAGDRIRTRLTYQSSRELASIRLAHPEGLILRSARVLPSALAVWGENTGKEEWTLHVDPPLQAGGTIELDCWMPVEATRSDGGKPYSGATEKRAALRHLSGIQPIGVDRYSGSLGVRRPGDWTGRLDSILGAEPISDESFVKSWGSLPDEQLTLCGTRRFVRECRASLSTGPAPLRLSVKPTVQLELEPGRIVMTVEAELSELSGRLGHAQARLPENIRIVQVTGDGLADWSTTADSRLHLMFDGSTASPRRRLRLLAWIPLTEEPFKIGSQQHRIPVPWIDWVGMEAQAGFLVISSISKPDMQGATGLTSISSESTGAGGTTPPWNRLTFRVDEEGRLGTISWESIPARVSVLVDSQMTIHPDSAEWLAVLRYDVVGGALDSIHLRMPASWAAAAELHFSGGGHQLTTETRGQTAVWTITPERPVWGSQRLVIRSSRALLADREITYPEISPLGRGAVDAALAVVNATGHAATIENPVGLERIDYSSRFQARDFAVDAGTPLGAFHVVRESPILGVQLPRDAAGTSDSPDATARLAFADVTVVVMPDHSSTGRATYELVPGSGSFLSFELPEGSSLLWATVDSSPVIPVRVKSGVWSIALEDRRQPHVGLIWRTDPIDRRSPGSTWPVGLPRVGHGTTTNLVTIYAPPAFSVEGDVAGLRTTSMARLEMARADWLARSINEFIARFDRSSNRDHEKLVPMLIAHEMYLRSAQRSQASDRPAVRAETLRAGRGPEWIEAARAARSEALSKAGLEQDLAAANRYLGQPVENAVRPLPGVPEPIAPDRIRTFGLPSPLMGVLPGVDDPPSKTPLVLESRPWDDRANQPRGQTIIAILVLMAIALVTTAWRPGPWTSSVALFMALGLAGYVGGPLTLAAALGLAVAGWKKVRVSTVG